MICPNCGALVADGALRCPRCRFELGVTQKISLSDATWCPSCGALVAPGADACPSCGALLHVEEAPRRQTRDLDLPEIGNTSSMYALPDDAGAPEIESAIPSPESGPGAARDRMPRPRVFAVAALCALVVVGGGMLLITHPWDPDAFNISATEPADTSQQGFPGTIETLTGQDKTTGADEAPESAAETIESTLTSLHEELGTLSSRADELEEALDGVGTSGTAEERAAQKSQMDALSIEVSNLISEVGSIGEGVGDYQGAASDLDTLGNWLRNRCDALSEAWDLSAASEDPAADAEAILDAAGAGESFKDLFAERWQTWSLTSGS